MHVRKRQKGAHLLGAHCSIAGGVANAPLIAAEIGANALQLFTGPNQQWRAPELTPDEVEAYHYNRDKAGICAVVAHAGYLINLAAPDEEIFDKSVAAMKAEINRAELLSIPWVVVHPGSHKGMGLEWGVWRIAEALSEVLAATAGCRAGVALETIAGQGNSIGSSFDELAEIIRIVKGGKRMAVCFDTCHAFAAGYELRTKAGYEKTWREFDRAIGLENLIAMHLNDSKGELGGRKDRHEDIGKGEIGLAGFRRIMNDKRIAHVPMLLETPKQGDAVKSDIHNLKVLRRLIIG